MRRPADRFDRQARGFDERAGLGTGAGRAVARAVLDTLSPVAGDALLEVGAGTGEIGRHLVPFVRYVGTDLSRPMLDIFRARLAQDAHRAGVCLLQCDSELDWPLRDGAATAVLASRVVHLLAADHVVAEVRRVCRPGGLFLVGRVTRDPASPQSRLRARREALLQEHGIAPGAGWAATLGILDRLARSGAARLDTVTAARWTASASPDRILRDWATLPTMAGVEPAASTRGSVLKQLREWAEQEFGDLQGVAEYPQRYTIDGVRLNADAGRTGSGRAPDGPPGDRWTTRC